MINTFSYTALLLSVFYLFSCEAQKTEQQYQTIEDSGAKDYLSNKKYEITDNKMNSGLSAQAKFKNVAYGLKVVSALDFLKRQDKKVDHEDLQALKKESVVIIEFSSRNQKEITDLDQLMMSNDKLMTFFSGSFSQNIRCLQGDSMQSPIGAQLDGSIRIDKKIKVLLFGLKIDLNKPFTLEYYDEIFGSGKMTFLFNEDKSLV